MSWTIEPYMQPGEARELSDKLARTLQRRDTNAAQGYVSFEKSGALFDSNEDWAYGAMLTIRKDGEPWFSGRRQLVDRRGAPRDESLAYTLADPWWFCRIPYNKEWRDAGSPGTYWMHSRAALMLDPEGNPIHTGQQITDFLKYVLTNAERAGDRPPFDIGALHTAPGATMPVAANIGVSVDVPWFEVNGISCLQGLQKLFAYTPDMCAWLDHSTVPPRLHVKRYADLVTHRFTVGAPPLSALPNLTACRDLQTSCVIIHFEVPDGNRMKIVTRQWPLSGQTYAWDRYEDAIRLAPDNLFYNVVSCTAKSINLFDAAWWLDHSPEYNFSNVSMGGPRYCSDMPGRFYVNAGSEYNGLTRELLPGSPMPPDFSGKRALPQTFRCVARIVVYDRPVSQPGAQITGDEDVTLTVNCTVTDCLPGTTDFSELAGGELGDPIPETLAKDMFDSLAMLHYKGEVVTVENEVTGLCGLGKIAEFDNVEGELAAARAMVQDVSMDAATGTTTRSCGPPGHLGLGERWEIMRRSRFRIAQVKYEAVSGLRSGAARSHHVAPGLQSGAVGYMPYKHVTRPEPR